MNDVPEGKLAQVRKLLDRANHPATPAAEAESCIRKADAMMLRHAIDQAMVDARNTDDQRLPITRTFTAFEGMEWRHKFTTMLAEIGRTTRCRVASSYRGAVTVVGMPDDVDYFEMTWTSVYFGFVSRINPVWNDNLSLDHNIYNFKKAGYKWPEIHRTLTTAGHYVPWPDGGALIRAYKRHAKLAGDTEVVKTQRHAAYRESFAEGYVQTICQRLESFRDDQDKAAATGGATLVLVDVKERVDEAFYEVFPHMRPMSKEERDQVLSDLEAKRAREAAELEERLAAMTPKERATYDREQEAQRRKDAKENERYWRDQDRRNQARYDSAGLSAGSRAGESVDLGGRSRVGGTGPKGEI